MQDKEIQGPQQQAKCGLLAVKKTPAFEFPSSCCVKCIVDKAHSITQDPHTSQNGKLTSERQKKKVGEEIARSKWPPGAVWLLNMFKALLDGLEAVGTEWKGEGAQKRRKKRGYKLESPSWSFTEPPATLPG